VFPSEMHFQNGDPGALRSAYFFKEIDRWRPKK
jgi:hypothetical protein